MSHFALIVMKFLKQPYLVLCFELFFMMLHSAFRPIPKEFVKSRTKIIASDGFVDEIDEEEEITVVFTKSDDTATLKHRKCQSSFRNVT